MANNNLYIVGNGFDLRHGIPSRYLDFGSYLKEVDPETYEMVDRYFVVDDSFWWEFEDRLAELDSDTVPISKAGSYRAFLFLEEQTQGADASSDKARRSPHHFRQ